MNRQYQLLALISNLTENIKEAEQGSNYSATTQACEYSRGKLNAYQELLSKVKEIAGQGDWE